MQREKTHHFFSMQHIKFIFIILVILVLGYFVLGEIFLEADSVQGEFRCTEFKGNWMLVGEDGTRTPIGIPGKYDVPRNEKMTVETTLPDAIPHNSYLCFRSAKQEMSIYVDDMLRQEYSTKDNRLFGKVSAVAYIFMELRPADAGKTLTLQVQTDSSYSGMFYTVYMGDRLGVWTYFFKKVGVEIIVAFFALILGLISIAAGAILRIYYRKEIVLEYLGWGVFIAAIWLVSNSIFRQLISPNLSLINDMAFLSLMLLPLPLTIYMNGIQKQRYEILYRILSYIIILDFVLCTLLHMGKWVDYTDTIVYMACVDSLAIICMGITIMIDIKRKCIREYIWVAMGILASVAAAFVQMIMYFLKVSAFSGMILALGLIFLLLFAVINTIGEIMQMERERQRALMSNELKGQFLARMSHEIRTPINSVLGMNAMVLRESGERKIREYAMDIQNAGQNLLAIINDILDFSKIDSGKMEIIPVEYDLSSMIHDIVNMISIKADAKELELHVYVDEDLPSHMRGDDVRIRQILVNLLTNAVKYTEQGSVTLRVDGETAGDTAILHFQVEDTGIGIRKEDLDKLYREFERIEEARNRHIEGTGLGMSIAVHLLELMESSLQVESTYGKGSTFSFSLRQEIVDSRPIGNLEERIRRQADEYEYNVAFMAPKAKILVVDDNPINRKVFVNLLKETRVKIEQASGGMECLEKIREKKYDMIFLDHMMPDMDGVETLHHMKDEPDHFCVGVPVIALTANAISGAREMYISEGFDAFISKPVDPVKLEQLLMDHLPEEKITYRKKENGENRAKTECALPQIDGIDWEYALLHTKDQEVLRSSVRDYHAMIGSEADLLEEMYHRICGEESPVQMHTSFEQYRIKVHAMKSSAALIGAVGLSGMAKILEYAARDERRDAIISMNGLFLEEWRSYKERLMPLLSEDESTDKAEVKTEEADPAWLLEKLDNLQAAMEDVDIDTADEIMKELKQYRYTDPVAEVVEKLETAVMNIDAQKTEEYIQKIKMMESGE